MADANMMERRFKKGTTPWTMLGLLLLLSACSSSEPEQAIRANLESMQQGLEARKAGQATEYLAENFLGNGSMEKQDVTRMLVGLFLRHQNIIVAFTRMDIKVSATDPYSATMDGVVLATGAENLLPQDGRVYTVQGVWHNIDGEWMLVNLEWE